MTGPLDRIESCRCALETNCREVGALITGDGRVSEIDAAGLLGLNPGSLKNMRHEDGAPIAYRLPVNGSRVSYRLQDLAEWIEKRRDAC
jgi:hypothetical protein